MSRSILEQELYEQFIDQGVDETTADIMAAEVYEEQGLGEFDA